METNVTVPALALDPKESLRRARAARIAWFAQQRQRISPPAPGEVVHLFGEAPPLNEQDPRFTLLSETFEALSDRGRDDVLRYANGRLSRDR
jgi:hypothetical protein